ncbi:sterol esterase [Mycena polygramma]|nr:sterol esterase [Mycena polygramma]
MSPLSLLTLYCALLYSRFAAAGAPTVSLPYGTFQGFVDTNLTKFLGVPFAQAHVALIFLQFISLTLVQEPGPLSGVQNATAFGPACPQQALTPQPIPFAAMIYPLISEQCLTLDIYKPIAADPKSNLPVFVWIFGGGFEFGSSREIELSPVVQRSIETGEPVIVVALNYRVTAFGFLAGKEVAAAGISNLGLRDQMFGLEWVQKYISAFGGDPDRVVIGGVSAGSESTSLLLLSNHQNSDTLFRGAFMASNINTHFSSLPLLKDILQESGSPLTLPSVDDAQSQSHYDGLVAANNCSASSDTLDCLRRVPFDALMATVNKTSDVLSYSSLSNVWRPYVDGDVVVYDPLISVSRGFYAKIPILSGDCDDEGTVFSFANINITTDAEFLGYIHSNYLPASTQDQISQLGQLYPQDPTKGAPFGTGTAYQLTPEYKRLSAFQGDFGFIGNRRSFLEHASTTQDAWSWLFKGDKNTHFGAFHGSDIPIWFTTNSTSGTVGIDALINFINTLDPNRPAGNSTVKPSIFWPKWNTPSPAGDSSLLTFYDDGINITADNFRVEAIGFLNSLLLQEANAR